MEISSAPEHRQSFPSLWRPGQPPGGDAWFRMFDAEEEHYTMNTEEEHYTMNTEEEHYTMNTEEHYTMNTMK